MTKITGDYAASNPFRFSSEYFDEETGLVYYNYRYYNPELGRWISRDPIEEQGGYNLYGMIGNNPLYGWDNWGYGHAWWCPIAAYSWAMTGDRNASSDVIAASENGFLDGFSHENYINYWSDILYQYDLSFSIGGYADYAFWAGAGISAEVEFSVSNGWGGKYKF